MEMTNHNKSSSNQQYQYRRWIDPEPRAQTSVSASFDEHHRVNPHKCSRRIPHVLSTTLIMLTSHFRLCIVLISPSAKLSGRVALRGGFVACRTQEGLGIFYKRHQTFPRTHR